LLVACAPVETLRPHPVTTDDTGVFDTSQGAVHLVLGCGGTSAPLDEYGLDTADGLRQAKIFTTANRPQPTTTAGVFARSAADAVEDATWSAKQISRRSFPGMFSRRERLRRRCGRSLPGDRNARTPAPAVR
jgi:hypothetical protein